MILGEVLFNRRIDLPKSFRKKAGQKLLLAGIMIG
jgi:hypothetical protein